MLDWHPDIDCTIKMLSRRGDDVTKLELLDLVSWEPLTETYNRAYMIDRTFVLDLDTGELVKWIKVLGPNHVLPNYLMEVETEGSPAPVLMSYNPLFYKKSQYMVINMSN